MTNPTYNNNIKTDDLNNDKNTTLIFTLLENVFPIEISKVYKFY